MLVEAIKSLLQHPMKNIVQSKLVILFNFVSLKEFYVCLDH